MDVPQNLAPKYVNNTYENTLQNLNSVSLHSSNPDLLFKTPYFTTTYLLLQR